MSANFQISNPNINGQSGAFPGAPFFQFDEPPKSEAKCQLKLWFPHIHLREGEGVKPKLTVSLRYHHAFQIIMPFESTDIRVEVL
jgi:hypothetical protein